MKSIPRSNLNLKFYVSLLCILILSCVCFWFTFKSNFVFYTNALFYLGLISMGAFIYSLIDKIVNGYGTIILNENDIQITYSNPKNNISFKYEDIVNMESYKSINSSRSGQSPSYSETSITLVNGKKYVFSEAEEENYFELRAAINRKLINKDIFEENKIPHTHE